MFLIILGILLVIDVAFILTNLISLKIFFTMIPVGFLQNTTFSMVSRSRNRDNMNYHAIASLGSNGIWYFFMNILYEQKFAKELFPVYAFATILGSVIGVQISMWIEKRLGATADGHLKSK